MLLTYLLAVSINDDASFATKQHFKSDRRHQKKTTHPNLKNKDDTQKDIYYYTRRIKSPEKAKTLHGQHQGPIGCDPVKNKLVLNLRSNLSS
jgi:hypothetical protein